MRTEFAKRLALLRRSKGVSQREAAIALQISQSLLSHYENGIREPGLDFLVRAADYYGVSTDRLLGHRPPSVHRGADQGRTPAQGYVPNMEQTIRNALDVVLDLLVRAQNPSAFSYATTYLGEVLYELLRQFFRLSDDYDPGLFFSLSDESFDSGAVVSDITWVRGQYILAVKELRNQDPLLSLLTQKELEAHYSPQVLESLKLLFFAVSDRISHQSAAERKLAKDHFHAYPPPAEPGRGQKSEPNQEDSL